jgi:hypothetical protein
MIRRSPLRSVYLTPFVTIPFWVSFLRRFSRYSPAPSHLFPFLTDPLLPFIIGNSRPIRHLLGLDTLSICTYVLQKIIAEKSEVINHCCP